MKILRRCSFLLMGMILGIQAWSLTIYEITYEFKNLTEFPKYTAFLVRYGNGTGFMRIRYTNKNFTEAYVVDMEFEEVEGRSKIDGLPHLTLQFKGKKPKYIVNSSGLKTNEAYNPDVLWFKKTNADVNFKPWGVTSQNPDGTFEHGRILDVKLLNKQDLTKSYVKQFFLEQESFYANFFTPAATETSVKPVSVKPGTTVNTTSPAKIHFILVASTNDPRIGYSVQKDVINISSQVKDIATFLKLPLNYVEVSGNNFGKPGVETALNNLKPGANDIVIFYYSGHGYNNDQGSQEYPQFDLRKGRFDDVTVATLNVSDVYKRIKAKNARLNLILSDCCNSKLGLLKPEGKNLAQTAKSLMDWDKTYCQNLFMQSRGSVLAIAAKKGQYAYGNTDIGGYFTSNLITCMEKYLSKFQTVTPTWDKIIAEAQSTTINLSMSNVCGPGLTCRQDPVYVMDMSK